MHAVRDRAAGLDVRICRVEARQSVTVRPSWPVCRVPPSTGQPSRPAVVPFRCGGKSSALQAARNLRLLLDGQRLRNLRECRRPDVQRGEHVVTESAGADAAAALLDLPNPPTAILAMSDRLAIGAIAAAKARGFSVPGLLSVVGFDDISAAATAHPPLTTVHQPHGDKGAQAVRMLLGDEPAAKELLLPTELVIRGSTAPPGHDNGVHQREERDMDTYLGAQLAMKAMRTHMSSAGPIPTEPSAIRETRPTPMAPSCALRGRRQPRPSTAWPTSCSFSAFGRPALPGNSH